MTPVGPEMPWMGSDQLILSVSPTLVSLQSIAAVTSPHTPPSSLSSHTILGIARAVAPWKVCETRAGNRTVDAANGGTLERRG